MNNKIKFGVVGLGHIGKRHAQCILDNKNAELISVCDIKYQDTWFKEHSPVTYFSDFDKFLLEDLDVINICTPNYLHAEMAIKAIISGKHVVVEKPVALSMNDAQAILDSAKLHAKLVFGVMQNRFSPTVIWLKGIIDDNLLGEINMVIVNCFWNRNKKYYLNSSWHGSKIKDGGPLFTQFSHFIDIINWIFGDFYNINAEFHSFKKRKYVEFEDSGLVNFHLKNHHLSNASIKGLLTYSTVLWNKNFESSITILGENGTIKIGGQYMDKVDYCDIKDYNLPDIQSDTTCNDYGEYKGSASNHDKMIDHVVGVLLKHNSQKNTSLPMDGLDVVSIIERIYNFRN